MRFEEAESLLAYVSRIIDVSEQKVFLAYTTGSLIY
jgi:hypothetical protein